jgi:hypothetical protein
MAGFSCPTFEKGEEASDLRLVAFWCGSPESRRFEASAKIETSFLVIGLEMIRLNGL